MVIGRLLSPVHSLGPGERVCLWTQGCNKKCEGCISPDLQGTQGTKIGNEQLSQLIIQVARKASCSGLTISGGDPFEQSVDLLELLRLTREALVTSWFIPDIPLMKYKKGVLVVLGWSA